MKRPSHKRGELLWASAVTPQEHEETSPRMTLAERMGYGVKGKEVAGPSQAAKHRETLRTHEMSCGNVCT